MATPTLNRNKMITKMITIIEYRDDQIHKTRTCKSNTEALKIVKKIYIDKMQKIAQAAGLRNPTTGMWAGKKRDKAMVEAAKTYKLKILITR